MPRVSHLDRLDVDAQPTCGRLGIAILAVGIVRILEHRNAGDRWSRFFQELQSLPGRLGRNERDAGQVAARAGEAGDHPGRKPGLDSSA